jgi:hypothetical protein
MVQRRNRYPCLSRQEWWSDGVARPSSVTNQGLAARFCLCGHQRSAGWHVQRRRTIGTRAHGAILVLEANSTRRVATRKAKQALEATNVRVLGIVLNNRTFPILKRIYQLL